MEHESINQSAKNVLAEDCQLQLDLSADNRGVPDDILDKLGLKKVSAFVQAERTKSAKRSQKSREKKKTEKNLMQLNICAPVETHRLIKDLAKEITALGDVRTALEKFLIVEIKSQNPDSAIVVTTHLKAAEIKAYEERIANLSYIKKYVARFFKLI